MQAENLRDSSVGRVLSLGSKGPGFESRQGRLSPSSILVDKSTQQRCMQPPVVLPGSRISQRDELLYTVATSLVQCKPFSFMQTEIYTDLSDYQYNR